MSQQQVDYIRWRAERAGLRVPARITVEQDADALLQFHIRDAASGAYVGAVEMPASFFPRVS